MDKINNKNVNQTFIYCRILCIKKGTHIHIQFHSSKILSLYITVTLLIWKCGPSWIFSRVPIFYIHSYIYHAILGSLLTEILHEKGHFLFLFTLDWQNKMERNHLQRRAAYMRETLFDQVISLPFKLSWLHFNYFISHTIEFFFPMTQD